jgi:hypothetical protein
MMRALENKKGQAALANLPALFSTCLTCKRGIKREVKNIYL